MESNVFYFIHGFPDGAEVWSALKDLCLGTSYTFDLSQIKKPESGADLVAAHLGVLAPALAAKKKIIIVSHDLGVPQAWALAPYLGSSLEAMVCINGLSPQQFHSRLRNPQQLLKSWYMAPFLTPGVGAMTIAFGRKLLEKKLRQCGWQGQPQRFSDYYLYSILGRGLFRKARTSSKVLQISASEDPFLLPVTVAEMQLVADRFEIEITPGGHWLQLEKPEWLAQRIAEFLKGVHEKN